MKGGIVHVMKHNGNRIKVPATFIRLLARFYAPIGKVALNFRSDPMTKNPAASPPDPHAFWNYLDLAERRIVGGRTDLVRKQQMHGFPLGLVLTGGRGSRVLYRVSDVTEWLERREALALVSGPRGGPGRPRKITGEVKPSRAATE